jgi:hypothetical protein
MTIGCPSRRSIVPTLSRFPSGFVRVNSCDFVDRPLYAPKKMIHEITSRTNTKPEQRRDQMSNSSFDTDLLRPALYAVASSAGFDQVCMLACAAH